MASKRKAQKDREAQVRWDLIDPVLDLLGYDRAHVTVEHACHSLSTGGAGRPPAPDYVVWLSTSEPEQVPPNAAFVLEAKAADEEVGEPVLAQAAGYANAPEIDADLIVLSNGRKLDVYERAAGEWEQRFARSVGELLRGSPALKTLRDIVGLSALAPGYAEDLGRYRRHGWEDVPSLLGGALLARDGVLDRVCDRCARPGVVGVQGPIGVGKSAFMWAVAERCLAARFRFDDQEPTVDDTLITLAYQTVVRWLGPGQMDDVRRAIGAPGAYELARSKLYYAAAHAASVPVFVIDSIDRADGGTRDLLTRLVTHTRDRIAWVVSARDGTLPVVVDEPVVQIVPLPPQDARRIWNQHREEGAWDPLDERLPRLPLLLGILIREQPRTEGEYQQRVRESVDETYQAWWERLSDEERELALHAAFSPGGAPLLEDLCGVTATKQVPEGDPLVENALKAQVPALAAVSRHVPDHFLWVHRSAQEFVQRQAGRYESQYRERWVAWAQRECAAGRRGGDLLWDSLVAAREDSGATGQVREWLRRADSDPSVPSMLSSVLRRLASLDPELGERVAQVLVDSPQSTADDRVAGVGHLVGLAADSDGARQRDLLLAKALPVLAGLAETHGRATGDCGYAREALADKPNYNA